jgi:hypothetical protein
MTARRHLPWHVCFFVLLLATFPLAAEEARPWLLGRAVKLPTEYTNQESGYFSIVAGNNGRLYIGSAKYGVDAYLIEFDPKTEACTMVVDVMKAINSTATGFAAQAKIHTRNNVGASGKIYFGSKQGDSGRGAWRRLCLHLLRRTPHRPHALHDPRPEEKDLP